MSDENEKVVDLKASRDHKFVREFFEDVRRAPPIPNDMRIHDRDVVFTGAGHSHAVDGVYSTNIRIVATEIVDNHSNGIVGGLFITEAQWEVLKSEVENLLSAARETCQYMTERAKQNP